jgi:hypothetical protein
MGLDTQLDAINGAGTALRQLDRRQPLRPHHVAAIEKGLEKDDDSGTVAKQVTSHTMRHGTALADKLYQD